MITNYSKPQILIRQILERLTVAASPGLNAMVIGPQYDLHRITSAEEFDSMTGTSTDIPADSTSNLIVPFDGYNTLSRVVDSTVKLYARDIEAILVKYGFCSESNDVDTIDDAVDSSGVGFALTALSSPNKIAATDVNGAPIVLDTDSSNPTLHPSLRGRPVKSGDIVYVTYKGIKTRRIVYSLEQAIIAPDSNEVINSESNPNLTFGSGNAVVTSSFTGTTVTGAFNPSDSDLKEYLGNGVTYNGEFSERFTVRVSTPTGKGSTAVGRVTVSSASGRFFAQDVVVNGQAGVTDFTITDASIPGLVITIGSGVNSGDGLFLGDTISATVLASYARLENSNFKVAGEYAYDQNDSLIIEVVSTGTSVSNPYDGAVIRITDTAGRMKPTDATIAQEGTNDQSEYVVLDNTGLSFRFQGLLADLGSYQKGLRTGDVYSVDLDVGSATGPKSVICLNGIAGNTAGRTNNAEDLEIECVELRCEYDGFVPAEGDNKYTQWVAQTDRIDDDTLSVRDDFGIKVNNDIRILKDDRADGYKWLRIANSQNGKFYAEYKAFVPAFENENIDFTEDLSPVPYGGSFEKFGKVDVDNPIALGLSRALSGAQGRGVYAARVESDDLEGYNKSLEKAEKNANLYAIVPLTDDLDVQLAVMSHVERMSSESVKRWRRAYVGTDSPSTYMKIGADAVNQTRPLASVSEYLGANTRVVDAEGEFKNLEIRPGDLFRTNFSTTSVGDSIYDEYIIAAVVDNNELILKTGPSTGFEVPKDYEVHKTDTTANVVDYVTDRSKRFSSRRVVNVWVDNPLLDTDELA